MPLPSQAPILTDRVVTLRAPRPDDVPGAIERRTSENRPDDTRSWILYGIAEAWAAGTNYVFVIDYQGRYAGTVGLQPDALGNASLHFGLSPWARGAGVATRAVRLALEFGFSTCGFAVIHWWAATGNWASRRVAWATGFHFGPTIPDMAETGGRRTDAWTGWITPADPREPHRPWFENPVLETGRLRLRTWRDDEIDRITSARTNQATAHFLPFIPQPFTAEDARFWLKDMTEQAAAGRRFNWCVAQAGPDVAVGNITLFNLSNGEGELGYWAHPDAQGRGLMAEALQRVALWFFASDTDGGFGGRRLVVRTAGTNSAARRVAESAGFRHVGTEREAFALGTGGPDDRVVYDLLASDQLIA